VRGFACVVMGHHFLPSLPPRADSGNADRLPFRPRRTAKIRAITDDQFHLKDWREIRLAGSRVPLPARPRESSEADAVLAALAALESMLTSVRRTP